jgi:hypothetical protein
MDASSSIFFSFSLFDSVQLWGEDGPALHPRETPKKAKSRRRKRLSLTPNKDPIIIQPDPNR